MSHVNKKSAVQLAIPLRLISAFVILCLESIIAKLATCNIWRFLLFSEAANVGRKRQRQIFSCRGPFITVMA